VGRGAEPPSELVHMAGRHYILYSTYVSEYAYFATISILTACAGKHNRYLIRLMASICEYTAKCFQDVQAGSLQEAIAYGLAGNRRSNVQGTSGDDLRTFDRMPSEVQL
jgi:hypothetical protein